MASAIVPQAWQTHDDVVAPKYEIQRVAVLGAGTMGSQIAAHVANAGVPVVLLDVATASGDRSAVARTALEKLKRSKPPALGDASVAALIRIGNFEDDLALLEGCDWVVEAVAEKLEIKQNLLAKAAAHLRSDAILTTNTSGLPIAKIAETLPTELRGRWFGTHFFNPPRYMRLLEVIATPETDARTVAAIAEFGERRLGKTVVAANDVPNFIANRIGVFNMLNTLRIMEREELSIEEIDVLTGNVIGWPKTATFRLMDMVGVDILFHVAENFVANCKDERPDVTVPEFVGAMVSRGLLGDKTKQGFYKKSYGADGKEMREVIDLASFAYRRAEAAVLPEVEAVASLRDVRERVKRLMESAPEQNKVARFYWQLLPELWSYAANRIGEVAASVVEIDRAMKAGFNWELGPFEMWDAAGVEATVAAMRKHGMPIAPAIEMLLNAGASGWYRAGGAEFFDIASGAYQAVPASAALMTVADCRRSNGVVAENASVALVDVGDGIGCFEFRSKMNTLDAAAVEFLLEHLDAKSDAVRNFSGFVIANDAANFSAGANLKELLVSIEAGAWDEIHERVRRFQQMTQRIKFCPRPVVAAPAGMTLGGGAEIALHAAARQPHFELAMGLVETRVGLLPGGGGCKEMLLRALDVADSVRRSARADSVEVSEALEAIFETIGMAKVSSSALEAREMWFVGSSDEVTMHRERLMGDAKEKALRMVARYVAPLPRKDVTAPGRGGLANLRMSVFMLREGGFISEHDATVAREVARVLCGGDVAQGTLLSEEYLLELEREGFLSLCGEKKTQERIAFTMKTGKPLRN